MDEERFLAADWLVRLRAAASRSQRERLAAERVMLLWERRRNPRQVRLIQEEEEEEDGIPENLRTNIPMEGKGLQDMAQALVGRGREFCRFGMVDMNSSPYLSVFVNYLEIIGDPADSKRAFPAWG